MALFRFFGPNVCRRPFFASLLVSLSLLLISCASNQESILTVSKVDDIPNISKTYQKQLNYLKKGMSIHQVNDLFPSLERECYESGICHFTVFTEHKIIIDQRISDLRKLSGSLISLLALTCALANDSCEQALVAAVNVGIATSLENKNIKGHSNSTDLISLVHLINHQTMGITNPDQENQVRRSVPKKNGIITLLQWINIEFVDGKVSSWAVNEPLEQYKPKTFTNELPPLDEAL